MEEKKVLTTKQKVSRYRAIQWGCFAGEFVSVAAPFIAIGIANYEKYFVQYNGTKMSIAAVMAFAVMGLAIFLIAKKKLENSYITLIIGWIVAAFIFTLMGELITDLAMIMWFGLAGLAGSFGLEQVSQWAKKKKEEEIDIMNTANKEEAVERYKEEKKTVKIKLKK